jgi:catechol 2,3-dioxygenase-like lactoylglutathione lyase family enzyme
VSPAGRPSVAEIVVAGDPAAWRAAGFDVDGELTRVGSVTLRLAGAHAGRRIVRCELRGIESEDLDGLPVARSVAPAPDGPAGAHPLASPDGLATHPNGVVALDHVVAFTPDLDRTIAAAEAIGLDLRRVRDEPAPAGSPRQAFFRLGETILELAQAPPGSPLVREPGAPARFYGLAFLVEDLDATVDRLGELVGEPRDAVQPGRRIATVRREAGLGLPVALMTRAPRHARGGRPPG